MTPMTEDEAEQMHEVLEVFWEEWKALVNQTAVKVPDHLQDLLLTRMQEKATVYGALE